MKNPKNYAFRSGALYGSLDMIRHNHELARLLDFDKEKLKKLSKIVDQALANAEKISLEWENQD